MRGSLKPEVGVTYTFKYDFDRARYGDTAKVTRISWSVPAIAHPGPYGSKWIDMETANGTHIQWSPATFKRNLRATDTRKGGSK